MAPYDEPPHREPPLILASGSPRRGELLAMLGILFEVCVPEIEEEVLPGEIPAEVPQRFSRLKATRVARTAAQGVIIGADTIVVHKGEILGKPRDAAEARTMLRRLRGQRHFVLSGLTLVDVQSGKEVTELCESKVWLREMSDAEIQAYVAIGDPMDKAAAYAIQNSSFAPVERVVGCPANVMGLPMCHVVRNLRRLGVELPASRPTRCGIRYGYSCALTELVMPGVQEHR
jgi:septum formation protein